MSFDLKLAAKGFILVDFLLATLLFSLAGSALYTGFTQGLRAHQRIGESFKTYDPFRILFLELERDLRNTISLKDYPFKGRGDQIQFPALLTEEDPSGKKKPKLLLIHYLTKDHTLLRREEELPGKLRKESPKERILLKNLQSLEFQFPYLDPEENRSFESFWLEEPYYGIPKGIRMKVETDKVMLVKTVSVPQGKVGHLKDKESL